MRLDLGGIAKGYAVDRAAELLAPAGPCLVNAGGDLAVRGGAWPVGVEHLTLLLERGAIATSGRDRRRWTRDGREHHHLIDPRTGAPADTPLLRATVVAASAAEAEVLAKAVFLGDEEAARQHAVRARSRRRHRDPERRPLVKDPTFWILARASGLTAYALLTLSVLAGLVLKSRPSLVSSRPT